MTVLKSKESKHDGVVTMSHLEREEDREPGEHAGGVRLRPYAQLHVFVERGLEVAGHTVHHAVLCNTELSAAPPPVVDVTVCGTGKPVSTRISCTTYGISIDTLYMNSTSSITLSYLNTRLSEDL